MQEVIIIIGLPGSGKSTLINSKINSASYRNYLVYDDWGKIFYGEKDIFTNESRYEELKQNLINGNSCILSCIFFCKFEYLKLTESTILSIAPNIKITKIYYENNPQNCEFNIKYRDEQKGGYWETYDNGDSMYFGELYTPNNDGVEYGPLYVREINIMKELSNEYEIPLEYTPLPIFTPE